MNENEHRAALAAPQLAQWFDAVHATLDKLFELGSSEKHRAAIVHSTLTASARDLVNSPIDDAGGLYIPTSKMLAAAARELGVEVTKEHWSAAFQNVLSAAPDFGGTKDGVGLLPDSLAGVFKGLMDEALIDAGVAGRPTILVEENRRIALGLAINWGLRFLLAYAMELPRATGGPSTMQDIWWIKNTVCADGRPKREPVRKRKRH